MSTTLDARRQTDRPAAVSDRVRPTWWRSARTVRWTIVVVLFGLWEALARGGFIDPLTAPPPSSAIGALLATLPTAEFRLDLGRTALTVGIAFGIGLVLGVLIGVALWRVPLLAGVLEPYLVTLYAMPTLVFYPILLALLGLGPGPIIVIAATMVVIPIALNTMVALRAIDPILLKMGRSVNCSRPQLYRKVLIPAATPLAFPGIKLGFIYAIIGTIAMEFILADRGLGFRVGEAYREFLVPKMFGLILILATLAALVNYLLGVLERRIRRDML